jgi:hypothetical protein
MEILEYISMPFLSISLFMDGLKKCRSPVDEAGFIPNSPTIYFQGQSPAWARNYAISYT